MTKRSAHPLILTLVIASIPLALGIFWGVNRHNLARQSATLLTAEQARELAQSQAQEALPAVNLKTNKADGRLGESIFPGEVSPEKQRGLQALAAQNYEKAQSELAAVVQTQHNDPESLIYLNNAEIGSGPAYVIAASMPISGVLSPSLELMRGVAHAQEKVNAAGGINGTPLKVLLFDDQGNSETAQAIASALVKDKNVLGVVGHYSSDTSLDAATVYEPGQLTMISPISTAVKLEDAGDYIFRTVPSDALAAKTLALNTLTTGKTKAAVFYTSQSTYSKSIQTEFAKAFANNNGEISVDFDISQPSFNAAEAVSQAQEQGADVLMLALTIDTAETSIEIIKANQGELPLVGGDDLYDPKILQEGQADALGLTVAVPWHIRSHRNSPFVKKAQRLWRGDVNWRTVTAFDATMALVKAIETDPTREGVAEALAKQGFSAEGATDEVTFSTTGDRDQSSQLVEVVPGNRSGSGYDYAPVQ